MRSLAEALKYLAVIAVVVSVAAVLILTRDLPPWRKRYQKPKKQVALAKDQIRAFKIKETCPAAFEPGPLTTPPPVQHIPAEDLEAIAEAVAEKILSKKTTERTT